MIDETPLPLAIGARIGPYDILGWIGAGGMGEVYRARDPRLEREVAIKRIAPASAADAVRVQRFEQEARSAGQLNHPNILAVYDSGVHQGAPYIVSELLEGESLRNRVRAGAIPIRKAVDYARQTADGLGAAHDRGIVHRDLKPDNLFVTNDGRIKILDFGIAKLTRANADTPASGGSIQTEAGTVVGTSGYMSPEQVRGEDVDGRSDIFSVGTILYEMLAGCQPFVRGNGAETMAAILKDDPQALPASVPAALERIVSRCLEKTREARFQSARDLAFALENLPTTATTTVATGLRPFRGRLTLVAVGSAAVAIAVIGAISMPRSRVAPPPPMRFAAELSPGLSLAPLNAQFGDAAVLSPDGTTIAFVARETEDAPPKIYIRRLDQLRAEPRSGTENAVAPFFSADSHSIGFVADRMLKTIAVTGGATAALTDGLELRGGSWTENGTIVFSANSVAGTRLQRIAATGGKAEPLTALTEGESIQLWPQILPGGKAVLFTSSSTPGSYNTADLVVQMLPSGARIVVQRGGYHGRYLPSGHVVYVHDGTLFALPFDLARLAVTGPPVAVLEGLRSNAITGGAQFSVSNGGTLMYLPGPSVGAGIPMHWMDEHARTTPFRTPLATWSSVRVSPDGTRLAMEIRDAPAGIWVYDLARDMPTRLTIGSATPIWSPGGGSIAFMSTRDNKFTPNLYWVRADGTGEVRRLTVSANAQRTGSWHPSGKFLAFEEMAPQNRRDIMILPLEGDDTSGWKAGTPRPLVNGPASDPVFSPDGRWLAYVSGELGSGVSEVFVRPFPGPGSKTRVSTGGGFTPTWSPTKQELFYGFFDGQIRVASYTVSGDTFRIGKPRLWSEGRYQARGRTRMFDIHPDGTRFVLAPALAEPALRLDRIVFVLNFFDELRRVAPASAAR